MDDKEIIEIAKSNGCAYIVTKNGIHFKGYNKMIKISENHVNEKKVIIPQIRKVLEFLIEDGFEEYEGIYRLIPKNNINSYLSDL